jgi:hypothetical protein
LPAAPTKEPALSSPGDSIADAIKQERLDQAEEESSAVGQVHRGRPADGRDGKMIAVMEGSFAELATAVSERFEIPQRNVLHLLRSEFRKVTGR